MLQIICNQTDMRKCSVSLILSAVLLAIYWAPSTHYGKVRCFWKWFERPLSLFSGTSNFKGVIFHISSNAAFCLAPSTSGRLVGQPTVYFCFTSPTLSYTIKHICQTCLPFTGPRSAGELFWNYSFSHALYPPTSSVLLEGPGYDLKLPTLSGLSTASWR